MTLAFITADTHFFDDKIRTFFNRPFGNVREMNEVMIQRWNEVVSPNDKVIHLGDFAKCWRKPRERLREQLNGTILIIRGNHDPPKSALRRSGFLVADNYKVELGNFILSHHPLKNNELNGKINLHGHIHTNPNTDKHHINVGVDVTNFYPVPIEYYYEKAKQIYESV